MEVKWVYDKAAVGRRLRDLRKKAGYNQEKLSELAGLMHRTYADIERGNCGMSIQSLMDISQALGVTPDKVLMDGVVERKDEENATMLSIVIEGDCPPERMQLVKELMEIARRVAKGE